MKKGIVISIVFIAFLKGYSQNIDSERNQVIDSLVNQYATEYSIVGLSIGIVNNGSKYTKHYGTTDIKQNYPISDSTMFHLASISKLFTATAILQLVEKKLLHFDDKLVDVLPDFVMRDKRHRNIRIRHLLTHSSGLMWNNNLKESPDDITSGPKYIANLRKEKLNFAPGTKLSHETYSNVGYDILGAVVERVSGKRFDEYIYESILVPLRMKQSTYYYEEIDTARLAIPQIVSGDSKKVERLNLLGIDSKKEPIINGELLKVESYTIYGEDYEHNPSGNLISSAYELNLWMQHNLDLFSDSTFHGILKHATLVEMWKTQKGIPNKNTSIGWGWWVHQDDRLGKSVFHVGNNPGFCSILLIYPEKNFGITVLCNGWYAQEAVWNKISYEIAKLYIGE